MDPFLLGTHENFSSESADSPLHVHVEGVCIINANERPQAGYGIYVNSAMHSVQISEPVPGEQTSYHAEVRALQSGLDLIWALQPRRAIILTDSQYACNGFAVWMMRWRDNNWRKTNGSLVPHRSVWQDIIKYGTGGKFTLRGMTVSVQHVSRNASEGQKRAGYLAKLGCSLHLQCNLCLKQLGRTLQHQCMPFCSLGTCKGNGHQFSTLEAYKRHVRVYHPTTLSCRLSSCQQSFRTHELLAQHEQSVHGGLVYECDYCCFVCRSEEEKKEHETEKCWNAPYCRPCKRWFKHTLALEQHNIAMHHR